MQALITSLSTNIVLSRKYYVDDHVFSVTPLGAVSSLYSYFDGGYFDSDGAVHYLHTDYRRSVVMTTDSLHRCTQHVGYYPYGLPHRQADGQPRLCESQELQTALNLNQYRYLARTLRPDLALWTTPAPLAPKYPHLNPYTYCASNPIANIDPTGTDTFILSPTGELLAQTTDDINDSFCILDITVDVLPSLAMPHGTINSYFTDTTDSGEPIGAYTLNSFGKAMQLFEFLADNTISEWSLFDNTNSNQPKAFVSSSFQEDIEASATYLIPEYNLKPTMHYHNHHRSSAPSTGNEANNNTGDINFAKSFSKNFKDSYLYIYKDGNYYQYSGELYNYKEERDGFSALLNNITCNNQE